MGRGLSVDAEIGKMLFVVETTLHQSFGNDGLLLLLLALAELVVLLGVVEPIAIRIIISLRGLFFDENNKKFTKNALETLENGKINRSE